MHISINLFLFSLLLVLLSSPKNMRSLLLSSSSETKLFDLDSLPHGHLTFLGDSHRRSRDIALTKEHVPTDAPSSAGVVLYSHPISFRPPHPKKVPSFHTMFTFSIESMYEDKEAFGDGLAFLISSDNDLLGSPGYLGLVDSTDLTKNKFIAIEFDTKHDSMFRDPDDNHVGLDINSLVSVKFATSSSLDLKSGDLIHAWIDYKSNEKTLEVFLCDSYLKPKKPVLNVDIDLSDYVKDNMFVGFSGATKGSMQFTRIEHWEFTVVESSPPPPPPSLPESAKTFQTPPESGHRHRELGWFAIGLTVAVCSVSFVVLFSWFCWKKLLGMIQKPEGTKSLEMEGISCQETQLSILVNEVARCLTVEKMLNVADIIRVKTVKSSLPLCSSLPAVKPIVLPLCSRSPMRTKDITSI